jgi:hypothetical protein|tara:strand:- start:120 stop:614 length:495 start_codon:yes stop_codon:yes gene_type:complete
LVVVVINNYNVVSSPIPVVVSPAPTRVSAPSHGVVESKIPKRIVTPVRNESSRPEGSVAHRPEVRIIKLAIERMSPGKARHIVRTIESSPTKARTKTIVYVEIDRWVSSGSYALIACITIHSPGVTQIVLLIPGISKLKVGSDDIVESNRIHVFPVKWKVIILQ